MSCRRALSRRAECARTPEPTRSQAPQTTPFARQLPEHGVKTPLQPHRLALLLLLPAQAETPRRSDRPPARPSKGKARPRTNSQPTRKHIPSCARTRLEASPQREKMWSRAKQLPQAPMCRSSRFLMCTPLTTTTAHRRGPAPAHRARSWVEGDRRRCGCHAPLHCRRAFRAHLPREPAGDGLAALAAPLDETARRAERIARECLRSVAEPPLLPRVRSGPRQRGRVPKASSGLRGGSRALTAPSPRPHRAHPRPPNRRARASRARRASSLATLAEDVPWCPALGPAAWG